MNAILTPEIITAFFGFVAMIVITQFPQFSEHINAIAVALSAIVIGLIYNTTQKTIADKQEATKVQIAKMQIDELRTYQAIKEQYIGKPHV